MYPLSKECAKYIGLRIVSVSYFSEIPRLVVRALNAGRREVDAGVDVVDNDDMPKAKKDALFLGYKLGCKVVELRFGIQIHEASIPQVPSTQDVQFIEDDKIGFGFYAL